MAARPRPKACPDGGHDPLAGVDLHGRSSLQLAHGIVKVNPCGRTSSDLDRASVAEDVEDRPDNDYDVEERSAIPYTDEVTRLLVELAIDTLAGLRSPLGARDPGARLSCLLSLCGEADSGLPDAVADARDHGYSWDDIALRLASTPAAVRRRYSAYARWRASAPDIDRGRP